MALELALVLELGGMALTLILTLAQGGSMALAQTQTLTLVQDDSMALAQGDSMAQEQVLALALVQGSRMVKRIPKDDDRLNQANCRLA